MATYSDPGAEVRDVKTLPLMSLLLFASSLGDVLAEEGKSEAPRKEEEKVPATLAEAHAELERILPAKELASIDAMGSEEEMSRYHLSLGQGLRNSWGLWRGSPLRDHLRELGFTHPDDMSSVILETFWCRRHGKDFRLKERAEFYAAYWEAARKSEAREEKRFAEAEKAMEKMMLGLEFEERELPLLCLPGRSGSSLRARFLAAYGEGVFIAVRDIHGSPEDDYFLQGYYFDRGEGKTHRILVTGVEEIHSTVVAGSTAWFAGRTAGKPVLVGIKGGERARFDLPEEADIPQLGLDRQELLAVYPRSVYRLNGQGWDLVHSGGILLPRSGPPPRLFGDLLFIRDEGRSECDKRLWWLKLGGDPSLSSLDRDVKLVGPKGPRWENTFSYDVTRDGVLWATAGSFSQSLLRRSKDGAWSIAILNEALRFAPKDSPSPERGPSLRVSAVEVMPDDSLLLAGKTGLYRLRGRSLSPLLLFMNTRTWEPSNILVLDADSYVLSGAFGGIYLLRKDAEGKWDFASLEAVLGAPVDW